MSEHPRLGKGIRKAFSLFPACLGRGLEIELELCCQSSEAGVRRAFHTEGVVPRALLAGGGSAFPGD